MLEFELALRIKQYIEREYPNVSERKKKKLFIKLFKEMKNDKFI